MPGLRPSEIGRWVRTHCAHTTLLVLTAHDRDCFLAQAVEAGVASFLTKAESAARIVDAVRRAAHGETLIVEGQRARAMRWRQEVGERWASLTEREREVLYLLAEGKDNQAIAQASGVTTKTVAYHVANILSKLGVCLPLEAAAWVRKHFPKNLVKIPG
ncbi:MAG: response regulator transcription factor [Thermoflexales bacterium]|nr:response regulator transcription factor [Thermoflexales bacterium]